VRYLSPEESATSVQLLVLSNLDRSLSFYFLFPPNKCTFGTPALAPTMYVALVENKRYGISHSNSTPYEILLTL
jgi:hypothetical protein